MSTPTHSSSKATAIAPANIAFIKYWGKTNAQLNLPLTDTISMNLNACLTTTTVEFNHHLKQDILILILNGKQIPREKQEKLIRHLNLIRQIANINTKAKVTSSNNFPTAAGIASSASGFAALTLAATAAAGLKLSEPQLSALARAGSGSAARSIPTGFVIWKKGHDHQSSYAHSFLPVTHWPLIDIVAVITSSEKVVRSTDAHQLASTSPYFKQRLQQLPGRITKMKQALKKRDLSLFGQTLEQEAIDLHLIAMSSQPPVFYWEPTTLQLIKLLLGWRSNGLPVYFTLDAGPNVHLITEQKYQTQLLNKLRHLKFIKQLIKNRGGRGAHLV